MLKQVQHHYPCPSRNPELHTEESTMEDMAAHTKEKDYKRGPGFLNSGHAKYARAIVGRALVERLA